MNIEKMAPYFEGKMLSHITPKMIEFFKGRRIDKDGVLPTTVNRDLACLKRMYNLAIKWDFVDKNPVCKVNFFKEKSGRVRYLTNEEIENLLSKCPPYLNDIAYAVLKRVPRQLHSEYVFTSPATKQGAALMDVKHGFKSALKRAGIKDFRFHDLRHTFASHLVMAGVDITTVKELLGHKDMKMTLRYAHLSPAHKKLGVDLLCNRFQSAPKVPQAV